MEVVSIGSSSSWGICVWEEAKNLLENFVVIHELGIRNLK